MAKQYANIQPGFDTFAAWVTKTNNLLDDMTNIVVTVASNSAGAVTTGNAHVTGTLSGTTGTFNTLRGGNVSTNATLTIASDVAIANSYVLSFGNSTVNTTVNATSFSGIANSANALTTSRNIALTTDATGNGNFNGTANLTIAVTLANSGVTANTYGNTTVYPVITVDAKGRVTAVTAQTVSVPAAGVTSFNTRTGAVTLTAADITGNSSVGLNYTPVSANTSGTITGSLTLTSGDLTLRDVISSRDIRVGNSTVNTVVNAVSISIGNSTIDSTSVTIGNSTVNAVVNSTSFSGIANNANNLGGTSLATLQTQITGNAATAYTNATSYVTTGGYTITGVVNYSGNVILTSGNGTNQLLLGTINATSIGLLANSTSLVIGNSTVNTTINSTSINTTSNTATFGTAVYVIANGNVGIANSAPGSKLTISSGVSSFEALLEKATVSATAATGTVHLDVLTQAVLYYTSNATANFTLNVRGSNTVTANSILVNGQSLTVAFLNTTGATAYYPNVFSIDSTTVTPKFSGGSAYISGNANSIDTYTYTIIKTANSTYTVLANQTQYK